MSQLDEEPEEYRDAPLHMDARHWGPIAGILSLAFIGLLIVMTLIFVI